MQIHSVSLDTIPARWRPGIRLISVLTVLLLAAPASAQNPSNITIGAINWPATVFAPDPSWRTGGDGIQDQQCQVNNAVFNTGWGGLQNQSVFTCLAVPHPETGTWLASTRYRGYTGHLSNTYFAGFEIGTEGRYLNGAETVNRFFLWDFKNQSGVFNYDTIYKTFSFNVGIWTAKSIDAPNGWIQAKVLRIYSNVGMGCDANNKGVVNYAAGASGVKDTLQVCAKDAAGIWAWRTIY